MCRQSRLWPQRCLVPSRSAPPAAGASSDGQRGPAGARTELLRLRTAEGWDLVTELFDFEHLGNRCLLIRQKE